MPKLDMNALFQQYRAMLENHGGELPKSPVGLKDELTGKPYAELNDFEKLMLFLAVYEEKAPSTAARIKNDIGYKDLAAGDQFIKRPEQLELTIKGFFSREVKKGFKHYMIDNPFALKKFASTEERQLLSDVAAIAGMEKDLSDALDPSAAPKERAEAPKKKDAAALAREQQLNTALRLFGVPQERLDNIATLGTQGIEFDGTPEFKRMAKATLAAFVEQKITGTITPEHANALRDAAIFYCDKKPTVRTFQSGRDRFDMALNVMTLASDPSDLKMRKCFERINAARKMSPGGKHYVSPESHYTEAEIKASRKRNETLRTRRESAVLSAEAFVTEKLTMMGERTTVVPAMLINGEKMEMPATKDMLRNDCINALGTICMDAMVKQQEAKKKRGEDGLPTIEEIKQHGIAYRTLLAATLAETVYDKEDTVRTTQLDLRTQEIIKRYDLDHKLDEIRLDTPEQIIATKNALKEVTVAYCKEKNIPVADAPEMQKGELGKQKGDPSLTEPLKNDLAL